MNETQESTLPVQTSRRTSTAMLAWIAVGVLVVGLIVGPLWAWSTWTSETAKTALLSSAWALDKRYADKVQFWVEFKEAGHLNFAELDAQLDYDARDSFKPIFQLSEPTIKAYREWRRLKLQEASPPKPESSTRAKQRLLSAVKNWDPGNKRVLTLIQQIEAGSQALEGALPPLYCTPETDSAVRAWIWALQREAP